MTPTWHTTVSVTLLVAALILAAPIIVSANIQIDGNPGDWATVDPIVIDDPNEPPPVEQTIPDYWDIDTVKYWWNSVDKEMNWIMQTYDSILNSPTGTFSAEFHYLVLDTDRDNSTGASRYGEPGMDYQFTYNMADGTYTFAKFVGGFTPWETVTGYTYEAARQPHDPDNDGTYDYDCFEIRIPYEAITDDGAHLPMSIEWGWAYDNGDEPADDKAPDDLEHPGDTPEPATTAMLIIGLAGLAYWRRQRQTEQ